METLRVEVLPEAASPMRLVATPGSDAGVKVTAPSIAEVAEAVWRASRGDGGQTP
jgi:hypothetical protein